MIAAPDIDRLDAASVVRLTRELQITTPLSDRKQLASLYYHDLPAWDRAFAEAGSADADIEVWRGEVENIMGGEAGSRADNVIDWGPVVPFESAVGKPFPLGVLPDWLQDFVEQEAEATQTPEDMAAMLGLSAIATAVAGRFEVQVRTGYHEPLNIYTATAMPPGSRKSTVFAAMAKPIYEYEQRQSHKIQGDRIRALDKIEVMTKRHELLRQKAAKVDDPEDIVQAGLESSELAEEIAKAKRDAPRPVRITAADVTPEKIAELMSANGERIALWNAEGGEIFEMMRGRYAANGRGNVEIYLKGHAGDNITVDRKGSQASINMHNPCLTMAVTVQPSVIRSLADAGMFRDRGLLGRILYSFPASLMGTRKGRTQPVDHSVVIRYEASIQNLLNCKGDRSLIKLTSEARESWLKFYDEIEPQLSEDAVLGSITDWAGKLPGAVARIAGLLHCGNLAGQPHPSSRRISVETMRQAEKIGRYLLDHALVAFSIMSRDKSDAVAQKVWRCITRLEESEVSERDVFQKVKGGIVRTTSDVRAALVNLASRGYVAKANAQPANGTGRPGSPRWMVNPNALKVQK